MDEVDKNSIAPALRSLRHAWLEIATSSDSTRQEPNSPTQLHEQINALCSPVTAYFRGISRVGIWLLGHSPGNFGLVTEGSDGEPLPSDVDKAIFRREWQDSSAYLAQANQREALSMKGSSVQLWIIDIFSRGEHLGFLAAFCYPGVDLRTQLEDEDELRDTVALLRLIVGEKVFAYRMQRLASPIETPKAGPSEAEYCTAAAILLREGMGVDGAFIRRYRPRQDILEIVGSDGVLGSFATDAGIAKFREDISKKVFNSDEGLAVLAVPSLSPPPRNCYVLDEDETALMHLIDIHGWAMCRLESDRRLSSKQQRLGTVAVYSREPRCFSERDLALLRLFAERLSDEMCLLQAHGELREMELRMEIGMDATNRAELAALLAHDWYHRVSHLKDSASNFSNAAKKAIRDNRSWDWLEGFHRTLMSHANDLQDRIHAVRAANRKLDEDVQTFDVADVVAEVKDLIAIPLAETNMDCTIVRLGGNLNIRGVRGVWRMVFFNLAVNAIDAQKGSKKWRKNVLHVRCEEKVDPEGRSVVVTVSDDGPGINRSVFPDPQTIFVHGETSKPTGTGLGLPVSRSLLVNYFNGGLELRATKPATFRAVLRDAQEDTGG